ncbi:MAG: DUF2809 domain-containing protein [Mariprofundales bacterium]
MKLKIGIYIFLAIVTTVLGLLSRSSFANYLPEFIAEYSGDTLWAALVYFGIHIIRPSWKVNHIAITAIVFAFTIEFSQLYHAPWIDQIRSTMIGGLILGFGFKTSDLVCYTE